MYLSITDEFVTTMHYLNIMLEIPSVRFTHRCVTCYTLLWCYTFPFPREFVEI